VAARAKRDLHGDPTFVVRSDKDIVIDPGFINQPSGVLSATLVRSSAARRMSGGQALRPGCSNRSGDLGIRP